MLMICGQTLPSASLSLSPPSFKLLSSFPCSTQLSMSLTFTVTVSGIVSVSLWLSTLSSCLSLTFHRPSPFPLQYQNKPWFYKKDSEFFFDHALAPNIYAGHFHESISSTSASSASGSSASSQSLSICSAPSLHHPSYPQGNAYLESVSGEVLMSESFRSLWDALHEFRAIRAGPRVKLHRMIPKLRHAFLKAVVETPRVLAAFGRERPRRASSSCAVTITALGKAYFSSFAGCGMGCFLG